MKLRKWKTKNKGYSIIINEDVEICISYEKSKVQIEELINLIKKQGNQIIDISTDDGNLEDIFLRLTKN